MNKKRAFVLGATTITLMALSYAFGAGELATKTNDQIAVSGSGDVHAAVWIMRDRCYLIEVNRDMYFYPGYELNGAGTIFAAYIPRSIRLSGHLYSFMDPIQIVSGGMVPLENWNPELKRDGDSIRFKTLEGRVANVLLTSREFYE